MFFTQVEHYTKSFEEHLGIARNKSLSVLMKRAKFESNEDLRTALLGNTKEFKTFAFELAKSIVPGRVACTAYASAVAVVAETLGIEYEVFSGYCLPREITSYDKEKQKFEQMRESGVEHPVFANHAYVVINGVVYEYFNGNTSNVEHFDVVKVK